jgi:hypothetical protein
MPAARVSCRTASSIRSSSSTSFFDRRLTADATARWLGKLVPPASCWPRPRSTSEATRSGTAAASWSERRWRGVSSISPPKRMKPPMPCRTSSSMRSR